MKKKTLKSTQSKDTSVYAAYMYVYTRKGMKAYKAYIQGNIQELDKKFYKKRLGKKAQIKGKLQKP